MDNAAAAAAKNGKIACRHLCVLESYFSNPIARPKFGFPDLHFGVQYHLISSSEFRKNKTRKTQAPTVICDRPVLAPAAVFQRDRSYACVSWLVLCVQCVTERSRLIITQVNKNCYCPVEIGNVFLFCTMGRTAFLI